MAHAIGIDLGTSEIRAAVYSAAGGEHPRASLLRLGKHALRIPAAVGLDTDGTLIAGDRARRLQITRPRSIVVAPLALLGARFDELDLEAWAPLRLVRDARGDARVRIGERTFSPVQLVAAQLLDLRRQLEEASAEPLPPATLTIPPGLGNLARRGLVDACTIAGIHLQRLVPATTAAALELQASDAYVGVDEPTLAICDLGSGSFSASILELREGGLTVLSSATEPRTGGLEIDRRLAERLAEEAALACEKPDIAGDPVALVRLRHASERAKIDLSSERERAVHLPFLSADASGTKHLETALAQTELEERIEDLVTRWITTLKRALADSHRSLGDLSDLLLIGRGAHLPLLHDRLEAALEREPNLRWLDGDLAALGAARLAALLAGDPTIDPVEIDEVLGRRITLERGVGEPPSPAQLHLPRADPFASPARVLPANEGEDMSDGEDTNERENANEAGSKSGRDGQRADDAAAQSAAESRPNATPSASEGSAEVPEEAEVDATPRPPARVVIRRRPRPGADGSRDAAPPEPTPTSDADAPSPDETSPEPTPTSDADAQVRGSEVGATHADATDAVVGDAEEATVPEGALALAQATAIDEGADAAETTETDSAALDAPGAAADGPSSGDDDDLQAATLRVPSFRPKPPLGPHRAILDDDRPDEGSAEAAAEAEAEAENDTAEDPLASAPAARLADTDPTDLADLADTTNTADTTQEDVDRGPSEALHRATAQASDPSLAPPDASDASDASDDSDISDDDPSGSEAADPTDPDPTDPDPTALITTEGSHSDAADTSPHPHTLRMRERERGESELLFPPTITLPSSHTELFEAEGDGATAHFYLHEGLRDRDSLGEYVLRGRKAIDMTFKVDANGILSLAFRQSFRGKEAVLDVIGGGGMPPEEVLALAQRERAIEEALRRQRRTQDLTLKLKGAHERITKVLVDLEAGIPAGDQARLRATLQAIHDAVVTGSLSALETVDERLTALLSELPRPVQEAVTRPPEEAQTSPDDLAKPTTEEDTSTNAEANADADAKNEASKERKPRGKKSRRRKSKNADAAAKGEA